MARPLHPTTMLPQPSSTPCLAAPPTAVGGRLSPSGSRPPRRGVWRARQEGGSELGRQRSGPVLQGTSRPPSRPPSSSQSSPIDCPSPVRIRAPPPAARLEKLRPQGRIRCVARPGYRSTPLLPSALPGRPAFLAIDVDVLPARTVGS